MRSQRKTVDAQLLRETPVAYMAFDALAAGEEFLIDEPLVDRRDRLAELVRPSESATITQFDRLNEPPTPEELHERFKADEPPGMKV